jgi:hypothetical protein
VVLQLVDLGDEDRRDEDVIEGDDALVVASRVAGDLGARRVVRRRGLADRGELGRLARTIVLDDVASRKTVALLKYVRISREDLQPKGVDRSGQVLSGRGVREWRLPWWWCSRVCGGGKGKAFREPSRWRREIVRSRGAAYRHR